MKDCIFISLSVILAINFRYFHLTFRPRVSGEKHATTLQDLRRSSSNVSKEQNESQTKSFDRSHHAETLHEAVASHSRFVDPSRLCSYLRKRRKYCIDTIPKLISSAQQSWAITEQYNASPNELRRRLNCKTGKAHSR